MKKKRILIVLFFAAIFILLLISLSLNWVAANFGGVGFDEIMFHLNMPMKGANSYVDSYIKKTLLPAIGILVEIIVGIFFVHLFLGMKPDLKKRFMDKIRPITKHGILIGIVFVVIWFSAAAFRAQSWFGFMDYMKSMIQQSAFFEKEYVDPVTVSITFPEKKRNLIYILMESAESSSQDAENGGLMPVNYIPEMTEIAKNNISFSQSDLIEGAAVPPLCGWTMAGIVAESAGLPLKLYKKFQEKLIVCRELMYGFDYSEFMTTDSDLKRATLITGGVNEYSGLRVPPIRDRIPANRAMIPLCFQ